jgi:hypothetical protein
MDSEVVQMQIHFPLLSILSVAFLLFFALQGGDVQLHSIEVGIVTTPDGVRVTIDPAFLVYADRLYPRAWLGETFGNVAVVQSAYKNTQAGEWIERFELNHIIQYRALGWWNYPLGLVLPIDPSPKIVHWNDPSQADRIEWLPPDGWRDVWHFCSISFSMQH